MLTEDGVCACVTPAKARPTIAMNTKGLIVVPLRPRGDGRTVLAFLSVKLNDSGAFLLYSFYTKPLHSKMNEGKSEISLCFDENWI